MKTQNRIPLKNLSIILAAALTAGVFVGSANAEEKFDQGPQIIYQSPSSDYGIYSYPSNRPSEVSSMPQLIHVSQAYGPAIHSYPHSGTETVVPWNVEFVDMAYGPAIYSYDRPTLSGEVKVLPIIVD